MPETVNIAGKSYPKPVVLGVGAAAAVVIGYAWFTKGRAPATETETDFLVPEEVEPTGILPFGGTQSGTFTEGPVAFRTEQEWYAEALDRLLFNYGIVDTPTASDALDRYLANRPLTATQIPMINFVINSIGPPPTGARTIRQETAAPGGTTSPPAQITIPGKVRNHKASTSKTEIRTNWFEPIADSSHSKATRYLVTVYQGVGTSGGVRRQAIWSTTTSSREVFTGGRLLPGHGYDVGVKAGTTAGYGLESIVHVSTKR